MFGFLAAFYFGWFFTLILLAATPILVLVSGGMFAALSKGHIEELRAYAQSGGYAEQALSAIKVV